MRKLLLVVIGLIIIGGGAVTFFWYKTNYLPHKGMKNVAWQEVLGYFQRCEVKSVNQTHGRDVRLKLKNEAQIYTTEPRKDIIIDYVVQALPKCGEISLETK